METIKQALSTNNLTHGILNKFIKIASEEECSDNFFYQKVLLKVLNFREELMKKEIIIPELEAVFKREPLPVKKRQTRKKVAK